MTDNMGVGAIMPMNFQYNPCPYGDFDDLDLSYSIYPMGMGSIFGGGFMSPAPMLGMGMGTSQNYFDNMKEYQKFYVDYNIDQQKMNRNADMRINASMEAIKNSATVLKDKIMANEQDQIEEAYKRYVNTVGVAYGEGTKEEIMARANTLYAQMNGGRTLVQDLREYSHGSATQGFIQAATFGMYDRRSAEDNISTITGAPVGTGEKTKHNLGRLAGAGTIGGIAYGIAKACKSGKAKIIGLAAAGVSALMSFITGKVST